MKKRTMHMSRDYTVYCDVLRIFCEHFQAHRAWKHPTEGNSYLFSIKYSVFCDSFSFIKKVICAILPIYKIKNF